MNVKKITIAQVLLISTLIFLGVGFLFNLPWWTFLIPTMVSVCFCAIIYFSLFIVWRTHKRGFKTPKKNGRNKSK